jgi:AcrR family transcriptional regulator
MSRETATRSETTDESLESGRLSRADRRDALLDAAVELVVSGDADAVSMEAVAERAGVSRPLVYKHFANRGELLAAVYQREATLLHRELAAEVGAAATVEGMFRTLIRGALQAAAERGHVFSALRSAGGRSHELRREQRGRDVETVRAFAGRAMRELGLDRRRATATTATLLAAIDPVLTQWRLRPTADQAQLLEEIYVGMVRGALRDAAKA